MAFKKGKKGSRPTHSVSFSLRVGKGDYKKGPSVGAWAVEDGPDNMIARGSLSGEYLEKVVAALSSAAKKDLSVSFSIWENDGKFGKKRDEEEEEEEDEEEEKPSKKGKKAKKSDGWDLDDD
jgi:hypothetical protein